MSKQLQRDKTLIKVGDERWNVPYGFGRQYVEEAREQTRLFHEKRPGEIVECVLTLLGLIGYTATTETISDWDLRKRVEAVVYARNVHLRASDNPLRAHPPLKWLPEPWRGASPLELTELQS